MAAFRETSIKSHVCCPLRTQRKNIKGVGGEKKKSGKISSNKHRDRTATARGPEKSRGPGSSTKEQARPLRVPSHPGLSAPSAAAGLPLSSAPTPGGLPGPPGPGVGRSAWLGCRLLQLVKMPACPSCGKESLSAAGDRELNPGTLKLTVGGKSSRA